MSEKLTNKKGMILPYLGASLLTVWLFIQSILITFSECNLILLLLCFSIFSLIYLVLELFYLKKRAKNNNKLKVNFVLKVIAIFVNFVLCVLYLLILTLTPETTIHYYEYRAMVPDITIVLYSIQIVNYVLLLVTYLKSLSNKKLLLTISTIFLIVSTAIYTIYAIFAILFSYIVVAFYISDVMYISLSWTMFAIHFVYYLISTFLFIAKFKTRINILI